MSKTINLLVNDANQLRDSLPLSGLFEMTDCAMEIGCGDYADMEEMNKMFDLVKSTIHIVNTAIVSDDDVENYRVTFHEIDTPIKRKK